MYEVLFKWFVLPVARLMLKCRSLYKLVVYFQQGHSLGPAPAVLRKVLLAKPVHYSGSYDIIWCNVCRSRIGVVTWSGSQRSWLHIHDGDFSWVYCVWDLCTAVKQAKEVVSTSSGKSTSLLIRSAFGCSSVLELLHSLRSSSVNNWSREISVQSGHQ